MTFNNICLLPHNLLKSGNWHGLMASLLHGLSQGCSQGILSAKFSPERSTGEGPASKLNQVVGRMYFILLVELTPLQSQKESRMVLLVTWRFTWCKTTAGWYPVPFVIFYLLEGSHRIPSSATFHSLDNKSQVRSKLGQGIEQKYEYQEAAVWTISGNLSCSKWLRT